MAWASTTSRALPRQACLWAEHNEAAMHSMGSPDIHARMSAGLFSLPLHEQAAPVFAP